MQKRALQFLQNDCENNYEDLLEKSNKSTRLRTLRPFKSKFTSGRFNRSKQNLYLEVARPNLLQKCFRVLDLLQSTTSR